MVMHVKCAGTCEAARTKYTYYGPKDCRQAAVTPGRGPKMCAYGCMGFGSCVKVCEFDAIKVVNGVAVVNPEKCVNCGKCIEQCPNGVIERIPYTATRVVNCSNKDRGKVVKQACDNGCLGCGMCARVCEAGAITLVNNLPVFDYSKCTNSGKCTEKCPAHGLKGVEYGSGKTA